MDIGEKEIRKYIWRMLKSKTIYLTIDCWGKGQMMSQKATVEAVIVQGHC